MAGISLRDYQLDAVDRMKNGCILCGGVGSGKSRTALAYYYKQNGGELGTKSYVKMNSPKDLYIITTARKRDTKEWEGELSPFLLSTHPEASSYSNKVVVDSWNNIGKYAAVTDAFFIFGKLAQFAAHLQDELAGGAEDQRAGMALQRLCGLDGRDAERGGLSGAGI